MNKVDAERFKCKLISRREEHIIGVNWAEEQIKEMQAIIDAPEPKTGRVMIADGFFEDTNMNTYNKVCLVESLTQEQLDTLEEKGRVPGYIGPDVDCNNVVGFCYDSTFDFWDYQEDDHIIITYEEMLTLLESTK